ncbi:MAG: hypothetical protein VYE68_13660 [Acidobacteriota bacterium]|nr:hypothetical protein [Acidobacteriota bacterium]
MNERLHSKLHGMRRPYRYRIALFGAVVGGLGSVCANAGQLSLNASEHFVSANVASAGDGTRGRPYRTLREAESASSPGDTIYVLSSMGTLDGGIELQPRQRLIGLGPNGALATNPADRVRVTNSTAPPGGVMVTLSDHNEVAGFHFRNMRNHAITGVDRDYSGTYIHHTTFSGNASVHIEDERGLVYAIAFDATAGLRADVRVEDSRFADGEDLGAIRVFQSGNSRGDYRFERNSFSDLGGRAYFVRTQHRSYVETMILDSTADNIGRGDRNSDSIIPYLMGQSEQLMLIRNYRFDNSRQEGNRSNTGIEAFMFGEPRPDEANWCTGCTLTLKILDSVLENAVTDSIQFSNSGRNSQLSYEIRNTRIIGGNPQQGGGGISLNLQSVSDSGGRTTLLVESTDVVGTTGYGFAVTNRGGGAHDLIVDLGGGVLGSRGRNRILDNAKGAIRVPLTPVSAQYNWWGGSVPVIVNTDDQAFGTANVIVVPPLRADPR